MAMYGPGMVSHEDSAPAVFEAERMAEPPVQYLVDRRLCSYRTDFPTLSLYLANLLLSRIHS